MVSTRRRRGRSLDRTATTRTRACRATEAMRTRRDGLAIEDMDMADNLMMQGGIERRGGQVIVHDAAPDRLYTDTTAFEICLRLLVERATQ